MIADSDSSSFDSEASVEGLLGSYYGGYGNCYNCGKSKFIKAVFSCSH